MNDEEDDDESHVCASAVEVDIGDNKKQICVGSMASGRVHNKEQEQV